MTHMKIVAVVVAGEMIDEGEEEMIEVVEDVMTTEDDLMGETDENQ